MNSYQISRSIEYNKKIQKILPGGIHHNFCYQDLAEPLYFTKANKSRMWDIDGNEYLDLFAKSGAMILGHNHEEYIQSLSNNLTKCLNTDNSILELMVLEKMQNMVPSCEMVRFGLSGTEIVQNAIRLARAYTGKNKLIRFYGHYHGNADNLLMNNSDQSGQIETNGLHNATGSLGIAPQIAENQFFISQWNDFHKIEHLIKHHSSEIAAVIAEPIGINGGGIYPQKGFLEFLKDLCHKHNILLIFDEIITGFRVCEGGAQQLLKVKPDLVCYGKCFGGGSLPISALAGRADIMKLYGDYKVVHGGTFNGYPLGMAAVNTTLEILIKEKPFPRTEAYAVKLLNAFKEICSKNELPIVIQGHPNCAVFHCTAHEIQSFSQLDKTIISKNEILRKCLAEYGILTARSSRLYVNISITQDDISFFYDRAQYAVRDAKKIFDHLKH